MTPGGDPAQDAAKDEQAHPEGEAHGATPPHGDPLQPRHRQTGGPHTRPLRDSGTGEHGAPEPESDSGTPPHGDPLAP